MARSTAIVNCAAGRNWRIRLRTTSDTEVHALFARDREAMLPKLRGMFALGIWDTRSKELFLARDAYGIKPLYFSRTTHGLVFASQVKALLASGLLSSEVEPAGLAGFYLWGSVPEPWTTVRDVFALAAGHHLTVKNGVGGTPVCWHDIRTHWHGSPTKTTSQGLHGTVRAAVTDSVRAHLLSDVPISVFLSAESIAIVAALTAGLTPTLKLSMG